MDTGKILLTQEVLGLKQDGIIGNKTRGAIRNYYKFPSGWGDERLITGFIQVLCIRNGIYIGDIDGWWGQKTQEGYESLLSNYKKPIEGVGVSKELKLNIKYADWPKQNYNSMVNFYGPVGKNMTSLKMPFEMVLAWDTSVKIKTVTCHSKCKDAFEEIWTETLEYYGEKTLKELRLHYFGGCLNVRKMRGGSSWSTHSWGCAWDVDPDRNRLRWGKDKAYLARPEYEDFWRIVESKGATSLGRKKNYDYMHFQFADV